MSLTTTPTVTPTELPAQTARTPRRPPAPPTPQGLRGHLRPRRRRLGWLDPPSRPGLLGALGRAPGQSTVTFDPESITIRRAGGGSEPKESDSDSDPDED